MIPGLGVQTCALPIWCYSWVRLGARSFSTSLSTDLWSTPRKDQAYSHLLTLLPRDLLNL